MVSEKNNKIISGKTQINIEEVALDKSGLGMSEYVGID
jgi:hypothetical protein